MVIAAEQLVQIDEQTLAEADSYLVRDVIETDLRADLELLDQARSILAVERERLPPWRVREILWEEWQTVRHLRRSRMTQRQTRYVLANFGEELYRSLRW